MGVMTGEWTPRLRGATYCSPRCGFGCSKAAFDQATQEAAALAARMGDGWKPKVWENTGWNYSVSKGAAMITPSRELPRDEGDRYLGVGSLHGGWVVTAYTCWLGGGISPQVIETAEQPEDALGIAMQIARGQIQAAHAALATIYDDTPESREG